MAGRWRTSSGAAFGGSLTLAVLIGLPARADDTDRQFDLLMVEQSISICGFPIDDPALAALDENLRGLQGRLEQTDDDVAALREQAAFSLLRQKKEVCSERGAWRQEYDRALASLADP